MWYNSLYQIDNQIPFEVPVESFLPRLFSCLNVAIAPPMILCPYDSSVHMYCLYCILWVHHIFHVMNMVIH